MATRGILTEMSNERSRTPLIDPVTSRINVINNALESLEFTPQSPDEMVIQQRGRRNIPVIYTSNPCTASQFEESPESESSVNTSSISLRSSARKRLLYDTPEELASNESNNGSNNRKRKRMQQEIKLSDVDCIKSAMKALSPNQLIGIIGQIVNAHPDVEKEIRRNFPVPDLTPYLQDIKYFLRNINKGLSNTSLISKTDHLAYKMVSMNLFIFKKFVIEQGKCLIESRQWHIVMEYVFMAWKNVRKIPTFDNSAHNVARTQCFKGLAAICTIALEHMKGTIDVQRTERYRKELNNMLRDHKQSAEMCIEHLNRS